MIAHSLLFSDGSNRYGRFTKVLAQSMLEKSPATALQVHYINDTDREIKEAGGGLRNGYIQNARKSKHLAALVKDSPHPDGSLHCLIDADTMITGDLSSIEDLPFDFAYTVRPGKFPHNTGVMFVRIGSRTRRWFDDWHREVMRLLRDRAAFKAGIEQHAGLHQAALGNLLDRGAQIELAQLPCRYWNSTNTTWDQFDEHTRVVHIIGVLRAACLGSQPAGTPIIRMLAEQWKGYDVHSAAQ